MGGEREGGEGGGNSHPGEGVGFLIPWSTDVVRPGLCLCVSNPCD